MRTTRARVSALLVLCLRAGAGAVLTSSPTLSVRIQLMFCCCLEALPAELLRLLD